MIMLDIFEHVFETIRIDTYHMPEPLVILRYFGPEVNPDAPAMGAYRKNKFN